MYFNNYQHLKNNETFVLIFLLLISIIVRIPIVLIFGDTGGELSGFRGSGLEDEWTTLVRNLIEHQTLAYWSFDGLLLPSLFMPPLYAYYLYFFSIFNLEEQNYIQLIFFSQILISALSVIVFYKINKIFFSQKISFYSSLLFSLLPLHVFACSQISSISLQILFTLLFYYFFFQLIKKINFLPILLFSFTSGLLILLRGEFVVILFLSLAYLFLLFRISIKNILLIIFVTLITISPYLTRNILTFETITITKSFGYNLWKGNNTNSKVEGYGIISDDLNNKIEHIPRDKFYEINLDNIFLKEAVKNIEEDPKKYLILFFHKIASFIFIDIKSSQSNYYEPLHYLPILLLAITSLIGIGLSNKESGKLNYLILIFLSYVVIFSCFFILPRYKLIIIPLQIIFSNILFEFLYKKFFSSR